MNAAYKPSFFNYTVTAVIGLLLAVLMLDNVHAATCFASAQHAYEHLLIQENAKTQARDQATININRATEGELVALNGIGSSKAQAIILYHDMFGDFATVDDLAKVNDPFSSNKKQRSKSPSKAIPRSALFSSTAC